MTRRDFVKSLSLAVSAFAAYPYSSTGKPTQLKLDRPGDRWGLHGRENVQEIKDESGVCQCVTSCGWCVVLTKTVYSEFKDPDPLSAISLDSMKSDFGLPETLAGHLKSMGFERFLTHERRCRMDGDFVAVEQDWKAWSDPDQMNRLSTPAWPIDCSD